jgi:hypothetical protein
MDMKNFRRSAWVMGVAAVLLFSQASPAQLSEPGSRPDDELDPGAILERSPGRMVQDGVNRALEFSDGNRPEITETEDPGEQTRTDLIVEEINIFFDALNQAIQAFTSVLLSRGGRSPLLTTIPTATTSNGTANLDDALGDISGLIDQFLR